MNTYQYTCAHGTSYQIMEQNSRITLWTKFYNSLALTEFFQHLKPTLKKHCEREPTNWDKYLNQVLASYRITPNLVMTVSPFFLVYGRDPNLPLHQPLEPMQHFLGDIDSGVLNLETHLSSHLTGCGSIKDAVTHSRCLTTYATFTSFTRWYPTFLQTPTHWHFNWKQTVFATDWSTYSG